MDLELDGKVAIVTGGSKGIGKAIALELAREGVNVAICARTFETLESTAKELFEKTGRHIVPIVADTTKTKDVQNMVDMTVSELGKIDILIQTYVLIN